MVTVFIMYGISILSFILGFVALLTQKIYIDRDTNQPTEIEIPLFGKLKTNIPAIVFVFIGLVLAYIAFDRSFPPEKVEWRIMGSFQTEEGDDIDWTESTLSLFPNLGTTEISHRGTFDFIVKIDEGITFENAFELIDLSHRDASIQQIVIDKEYEAYMENQPTLIENATKSTRKFKPITVIPSNDQGGNHE